MNFEYEKVKYEQIEFWKGNLNFKLFFCFQSKILKKETQVAGEIDRIRGSRKV